MSFKVECQKMTNHEFKPSPYPEEVYKIAKELGIDDLNICLVLYHRFSPCYRLEDGRIAITDGQYIRPVYISTRTIMPGNHTIYMPVIMPAEQGSLESANKYELPAWLA